MFSTRRAGKFAEEVERVPELKQAIKEGRPVLHVRREIKVEKTEARRAENRAKIATAFAVGLRRRR